MIRLFEQELAEISGYIKERFGVNLTSKSTLIESRLGCYIMGKGFKSYGEYFDYAKSDPSGEEMTNLINRITTNHTFFMRENDHFEIFTKSVLPWIESLPDGNDMRVWSAGCATGEEPYGLSIYILEYMAAQNRAKTMTQNRFGIHMPGSVDTTILASDISERALAAASEGVYFRENLSAMPQDWISKYFIGVEGEAYRVAPELRANVAFKKINLLDPIKASKPYHAVFCRNVMIYFDADTRVSLIDRLYHAMAPGAYLFIGHSESLANCNHRFKYLQPSVYRKPFL